MLASFFIKLITAKVNIIYFKKNVIPIKNELIFKNPYWLVIFEKPIFKSVD